MPRIHLTLEPDLHDYILKHKPKSLTMATFCGLLLEQQLTGGSKLPAYCVGAGTTGETVTESDLLPPPAQLVEEVLTPDELSPPSLPPMGMGEGVGKESEGTPRKGTKQVSDNLTEHEDLIRDFWRTKGGSKGDRAWSLLLTELTKIQNHHGDTVLRQQIELAINGKWKGITLANLERFTKPTPAASGGYVDSISRDRIERDKFLSMFSPQEAA